MRKRVNRKPKPGVYEDVPYEVYDSWPYVNSSSLKHAVRSAGHYRHAMDNAKSLETPQLRLGHLVHAVASDDLASVVIFQGPEWEAMKVKYQRPTTTREWEHRVGKLRSKHPGREIYTHDEWLVAEAIHQAIMADTVAAEYLRDARRELSIVWDCPATRIRCKARLDAVSVDGIVDIKTTYDAAVFERAILQYHYHRQLAFYQWGWAMATDGELRPARIIAVESEPFHGVKAAPLSDRLLSVGREEYEVALERISRALKHDRWDGYASPAEWDCRLTEETTIWIDGKETAW